MVEQLAASPTALAAPRKHGATYQDRTNPKRGVRLPPPPETLREAASDRQPRHRQARGVTCADNGVAHELFDHGRHCLARGDRVLSDVGFSVSSPLRAPPNGHEHQKPSHSHAHRQGLSPIRCRGTSPRAATSCGSICDGQKHPTQ